MKSFEIRSKYLEFFRSKGHTIVTSDTLVPLNDPSVLFTGAGMNQFKEQFMGKNLTYTRATSCQKCIRTGDVDNVGRTAGHQTFFEMLGNFSFGDYFKKEACAWAWEFMTETLKIPREKLWISVYQDDSETYDIWKKIVPEAKLVKMGAKDNFWPSNAPTDGPNGPCGPCSEIYFDKGADIGCGKENCNPACDCGRFIEVWNLVFTQFNRVGVNQLEPLPSKNIDTGMGLERMTSVMQGVRTNFETDLFVPVINEIRKYAKGLDTRAENAIADHVRAAVFAIADGVTPSNEERGYVIRKLIRRAYLLSRSHAPFLFNLVPKVVSIMNDAYPVLRSRRDDIALVIKEEETRFQATLSAALPRIEAVISALGNEKTIPGAEIFRLVDTYGVPLDVIQEKAEEHKCMIDSAGYEQLMSQQKEQSRKGSKIQADIFSEGAFSKAPEAPLFYGEAISAGIAYMVRGKDVATNVSSGERVLVFTSPQNSRFYPEGGGQAGDSGTIKKDGAQMKIIRTIKTDGRIVHDCVVEAGGFKTGDRVSVEVDINRNSKIARNHTATHLLQAALRSVLGEHVHQAGSFVTDERLRFDFTHMKKLSDEEIWRIEDYVNQNILASLKVKKEVKDRAVAEKEGAMALFGEKYGETVRVVTIGEQSKEFCGGSHVDYTSDIELFKILNEGSIASGVRRIEAITGEWARIWLKSDMDDMIANYERSTKIPGSASEVFIEGQRLSTFIQKMRNMWLGSEKITWERMRKYTQLVRPVMIDEIKRNTELQKEAQRKLEKDKSAGLEESLGALKSTGKALSGFDIFTTRIDEADMNMLRKASDILRRKNTGACIVLGSALNGRPTIVVTHTADLNDKGVDAQVIVKEAAKILGGSGGGRKDFAQAGGTHIDKLDDAINKARELLAAI